MAELVPYHDRDGFIWMDGKLLPWREANIHILTHALHYGSAVFEGERAYGGEIFKLTEHSERLIDSAKILEFEVPYTAAELDQACRDVIAANKLSDCYVRPIAWRGSEQMGVAAQLTKIHVAIAAWEWGSYFPMEQRLKGIRIGMAKYRRPDPATAPAKAKAAGLYMICTIEKHRAERAGYADAHDARLPRPRRRVHGRQHVLRSRTASSTRRTRIASSTASRAAPSSISPASAATRSSSAPSCRTSSARSRSASSPARPPR